MRNIEKYFLEKSGTKCFGEAIPRHFNSKNSKLAYLWINSLKCYKIYFFFKVKDYKNILKPRWKALAFTSYKAFLRNTERSRTSLPTLFSSWLLRKIFLFLYFINWPNFIDWLPLLLQKLGNICIVIICCPVFDVINFEVNKRLLLPSCLSTHPKSQDRNVNISRTKNVINMKLKIFFIIFKGFSIVKNCFRPETEPLKWILITTVTNFFLLRCSWVVPDCSLESLLNVRHRKVKFRASLSSFRGR